MVVLSAKDLGKEYGTDVILSGVSFQVHEKDRVGIVGPNGAGKTTLLRMLAGELPHDMGEFTLAPDTTIGYLHQNSDFHSQHTIREEVEGLFSHLHEMEGEMHRLSQAIPTAEGKEQQRMIAAYDQRNEDYRRQGGYTYQSEMRGILASMAFAEDRYDQKIESLSGGEKTRLALALLLLQKPDILLLDEPTNHLDIGTLTWLEQYLANYNKTLLVVSHDRYFLDRICRRIFDVEGGTLQVYEGNYTAYAEKKKLRRLEEQRRYEAYEKEWEKQEDLVRRFKERGTEKLAKRARSREIKLEKMEQVAKPTADRRRMNIAFKERYQSGNDVLLLEDVGKGSQGEGTFLFEHVNLDLKRGEKVCMVGNNGIGKTTLLKMILGQLPREAGRITFGHNVKPAYYDQEQSLLRDDLTVLEEVHDDYATYTATELRTILGSFLFRGDDVFLEVGALSGGEKARLALLKLMLSGGNLLLLDEPTNHLDIESREIFEEALLDFPGTALIISHDRYFLNKVPDRIVELTPEGLENYLGKYDYYTEKSAQIKSGKDHLEQLRQAGSTGRGNTGSMTQETTTAGADGANGSDAAEGEPKLSAAEERRLKKEQEAKERRHQRELAATETKIAELEQTISDLEQEMITEDALADPIRLAALGEQLQTTKEELEETYERWADLAEQ